MAIEFLLGLIKDFGPGAARYLKKVLKQEALEDLFFKAFSKALKAQDKKYQGFLQDFEKKIKKDKQGFLELFITDTTIEKPGEFFYEIKTPGYRREVAERIVKEFSLKEDFREVMVLIVNDCLEQYKEVFLETIDGEQAAKLVFREQISFGADLNEIRELLEAKKEEAETKVEEKQPKPKQIKILSIMASPEAEKDDYYIHYEKEQDTMLDAFKVFDRETVFLDMPDPVNSTLFEIEEYLKNGHHDILYISAHGGKNENDEGILFLEDAQGKVQKVTGMELVKVLNPCPKVVILSACHSASRGPDLIPAAQALYDAAPQVDAVIGMKKAVSHLAAIDFNTAFFKALCERETVKQAFEKGKDNIMKGEVRRLKEMPNWPFQNEHEIPRLLAREEDLCVKDFSDERIDAPGRPGSHEFMGAKFLERGFIGRRGILRKIYKEVEDCKGAVVLKGPGGIGKSTLTTRAAANLRRKGYDFIVVQGETSVERILETISKKAKAAEVKGAEEVYQANAEEKEKLKWYIENFLKKHRMVMIFDNFEENQDEKKDGAFFNEGLKTFLWFFREVLLNKNSILFFSTRYRMPGFDGMDIGEFSPVEFRKMQLNRNALKRLDGKSVNMLQEEIGGNPRALDLLDRIACQEFGEREFNWEELKSFIPELRERLLHKKSREDDFTPLFLARLLDYLTKSQLRLLNVVSIYRIPVNKNAVMAHNVSIKVNDRRKLEDLSLMQYLKDHDLYYVHRLTAQYLLKKMRKDTRHQYHCRAAENFWGIKDEEGNVDLNDAIESRWHYLQAAEWNRAAEITFGLESYLTLHGYPQQSIEVLQELEKNKMNDKYKFTTHLTLGNLYHRLGEYQNALTHYNVAMEIAKKVNDIKRVALSMHGIGYVHQEQGRYEEALNHYNKSRKIFEKADAQKNLSGILHQIGMIYQYKGDYDAALTQYQKSMEIKEKIGDIKGVSDSLHNIGAIYQDKGDYDAALTQYQKSMEIDEKIGDIKGVSYCLHEIGIIYQDKGDYDAALTQYQKSMEIREKIGDIKGISESLHQIGMIYQDKGDYDAALTQYQKSMEIKEKIGDIVGAALTMGQMGKLFFEQKEFETALKLFIKAFLVFAKVGSPYANLAKQEIARVREKLPEERFEEVLKEFGIEPGEEER